MVKDPVERDTCSNCGVDVRENTQFCYNCGSPVDASGIAVAAGPQDVNRSDAETKAALDELAEKLSNIDESDKLAKAAAERKQARVSRKKTKEFVWEENSNNSGTLIVLISLLIAAFTAFAVYFSIFWR